jgi:hypothetical protein
MRPTSERAGREIMAASFDSAGEDNVDMAVKIEDCTELKGKSLNQSGIRLLEDAPKQELAVSFRPKNWRIDDFQPRAAELR